MVYLTPASQCCCGCTLEFGTKLIMLYHLFQNVFFIMTAVGSIIVHSDILVSPIDGMGVQIFIAGLCLAGLPLILLALWAVSQKYEVPIRMYWWYMVLCILVDMVFVVKDFVLTASCGHLPGVVDREGKAFACGVLRLANYGTVFMMIGVQCYCLFVVFSFCEDLAHGGGPDLTDLASTKGRAMRKAPMTERDSYYDVGSLRANLNNSTYGSAYDGAVSSGLGGSTVIFGGVGQNLGISDNYHDMSFPPRL